MFLAAPPLTFSSLGRLPGILCIGVILYLSDCIANLRSVFSSTFFSFNIVLHFVEAYPLRVKKTKQNKTKQNSWEKMVSESILV